MMEAEIDTTSHSASDPLHTEETEVPVHNTNCENCVLCTISKKAHSWRNSSSILWERAIAGGKSGINYVYVGVSSRYQSFQESHPNSAEFIGETGRRIRALAVVVSDRSVSAYHQGVSRIQSTFRASEIADDLSCSHGLIEFIKRNPIGCYFFAGIVLLSSFFLFTITAIAKDVLLFTVWLFIIGFFLLWVPLYYFLYCSADYHRHRLTIQEERAQQARMLEKPPEYSTLPPLSSPLSPDVETSAPPTYEEVLRGLQAQQVNNASGAVYITIPVCPVHQATSNTQNETRSPSTRPQSQQTNNTLPRSRSLVDLRRESQILLV